MSKKTKTQQNKLTQQFPPALGRARVRNATVPSTQWRGGGRGENNKS